MSRGQSVEKRDEAFRMVERACAALGLPVEAEGARRYVRYAEGCRWVLSGGGGSGTLRVSAEALTAEGWEQHAEMTVTLDGLLRRLTRLGTIDVTREEAAHGGE